MAIFLSLDKIQNSRKLLVTLYPILQDRLIRFMIFFLLFKYAFSWLHLSPVSVSRFPSKVMKRSGFLLGHWGASCVGGSFLRLQTLSFGEALSDSPPCLLPASRWLPLTCGSERLYGMFNLVLRRKSPSAAKCSVCLIYGRPASECIIHQSESPNDWHHPPGIALQGSKAGTCAVAVRVIHQLNLHGPRCCLSCESEIRLEKVLP